MPDISASRRAISSEGMSISCGSDASGVAALRASMEAFRFFAAS